MLELNFSRLTFTTKGLPMTVKDDIPLFPVAEITIGPVVSLGLIVIRPDFLSHLSQQPEEATHGRSYALTPVQALFLVQKILSALDVLEKSPLSSDGNQQH